MFKKFFKNIGPGPLIAAAFIGPGTVTLCTLAGVQFGMALLWTLLIAILAAIVLQSMAVKIGIITRRSITQLIIEEVKNPLVKRSILTLIFAAISIGNTAYEAGNISGAALGLESLFGYFRLEFYAHTLNLYPLLIGCIAATLLWSGKHKIIERSMIGLVLLMSISFLFTAFATTPNLSEIFSGLFHFQIPQGSLLMIIGLVGTTIVPYNLFLHAELVKNKWLKITELQFAMRDMLVAMGLGGAISLSIIITASGVDAVEINNATDLGLGLEPLFGSFAKYFLAVGLFAAGITSTITAPLAAAFVVCGCFGWKADLKAQYFKLTWLLILLFGVLLAATGLKLIAIIQFAQITNGILLPVIATLLLWIVNKSKLFKAYKNNIYQNIVGVLIVVLTLFLSIRTLLLVF